MTQMPAAGAETSILVVSADPAGDDDDDRSVRTLIDSLAAASRHNSVTVRLTERTSRPSWNVADAELVGAGPPDPVRDASSGRPPVGDGPVGDEEWGTFSHVVLTSRGDLSRAREWIELTQPQAARVAFFPSLPFRAVDGLRPLFGCEAQGSLDQMRMAAESQAIELAAWADAVWCEQPADHSWLCGQFPWKTSVRLPLAVDPIAAPEPLTERDGLAVVAAAGHDVSAANEDAAIRALGVVLTEVRWRQPRVRCRLITDRPSPALETAARQVEAELVPASDLAAVIGSCRLVIAAHAYGTGQRWVIAECLRQGTPFVATARALGGLDVGPMVDEAIFESDSDLALASARLLSDDAEWYSRACSVRRVALERYGSRDRLAALRGALATIGISCAAPWETVDARTTSVDHRLLYRPPKVAIRPGDPRPRQATDGSEPVTDDERYRVWAARSGPTPEVLAAIEADLQRLSYRPTISILMPVHDTDPLLLREAVQSVGAQIYGGWQLCIANDCSGRAETLAVLEELRGSAPKVQVVDLPSPSGISGATNAALAVADGDFVTFLDHDDLLKPHALAQVARWLDADPLLDMIYSDEDKLDPQGLLCEAHLKPDWAPDQLLSQNYVCHLKVVRRSLVVQLGGLRSAFDGSQDHDLVLRVAELTDRIAHIPEPLYTWRKVPGSAAADESKPYARIAGRRAVQAALERRYGGGTAEVTAVPGLYRPRIPLPGKPRVAIIVPTRDRADLLRRCVGSILERSSYDEYEIVVVDNQSSDPETLAYLGRGPWRLLRYPHEFNFARMMNLAARSVRCDALLFLNNDTEVITPDWIEAMLEHSMRPDVGIVGGRLFFEDGEPQHEGVVVGRWADWATNINHRGWWHRGDMVRDVSAVTAACAMIRPSVYWRVGGDDERLRVAYNDVDLCLRVRQAGYRVVYTPYAALYHHEGSTRGSYQHQRDAPVFNARWEPMLHPDPYYNPLLSDTRPFVIELD